MVRISNYLARVVGFADGEITPYTLRRGGASWYFTTYQWALASSARGYVAQSVVELATVSLSKPTQMCIHGMRQVLPGVLPRSARVIYCSAIPSCGTCVSTK